MKKLIVLLLISALVCMSLFTLAGCSKSNKEDLSTKITEKVAAYRTDLLDSAGSLTSASAVSDYLCDWAKSKSIDCTKDKNHNVIMSIKAGKAYKEADPTVVVCSYDPTQFESAIDSMAMALYLAKNNENTGKLTVIFAEDSGHNFSGIQKVSSKYFPDNANVFCLNPGSSNMWSVNTGARSSYTFTSSLAYTDPTKGKAYRISIKGLPGGIPDAKISSYPNPIKSLGDLLAYFKTNSLIFELAKVRGGSSSNVYPKSASVTVVIDENDDEKFISRMETAIENFNEDFLERYPEASYTYEEVKVPSRVLTQDSLNELISILYTILDSAYYVDEDENLVSIRSIGSIRLTDDSYIINAVGNSLTEQSMKEIDNDYKTICGLADVTFKKNDAQDLWSISSESPFALEVMQAFNDYCGKDMEFKDYVPASNTSYIQKINKNCNIINVSVNEDRLERYTGTLITFMMNQPHTDIVE